jgi:hypothetical protein
MRGNKVWRTGIIAFLLLAAGPGIWAQQRRLGRQQPPSVSDEPPPSTDRSLNRKMLKASYEQLQKDVQRLNDLAGELKEQVTNTDNEDTLSLSGVKKAEEIEKLAKKIQGRIKNL